MVSVLGNHYFEFPKPLGCNLKLKDLLEDNVPQNYYISEKLLETYFNRNKINAERGNGFKFEPTNGGGIANSLLTKNGTRPCDNYIREL